LTRPLRCLFFPPSYTSTTSPLPANDLLVRVPVLAERLDIDPDPELSSVLQVERDFALDKEEPDIDNQALLQAAVESADFDADDPYFDADLLAALDEVAYDLRGKEKQQR
jgi:hypothetical protein